MGYPWKQITWWFFGQTIEAPTPASTKVDVFDVARKVAFLGRVMRARFGITRIVDSLVDGGWRSENHDQRGQSHVKGSIPQAKELPPPGVSKRPSWREGRSHAAEDERLRTRNGSR